MRQDLLIECGHALSMPRLGAGLVSHTTCISNPECLNHGGVAASLSVALGHFGIYRIDIAQIAG